MVDDARPCCAHCRLPFTPRPYRRQRFCSHRCAGKGGGGRPPGQQATTRLRDAVLAALRTGPRDERSLALAVYGDDGRDSILALRALLARSHDAFYRQHVHVETETTRAYRLVNGYRAEIRESA